MSGTQHVLRVGDLAGRRVVVWGLGREGAAAARAARRAGAREGVAVTDAPPSPGELEAWTAAATGRRGKPPVPRLTAHLLEAVGRDAVAAGNIGTALLDLLPDMPADP